MWQGAPFIRAPYLFLIFFILYSHEINNFNLSIDDERHAFSNDDFIPLGRWLFPIIQNTVWPQFVVPHAPYLIFGALISITYCLILAMIRQAEVKPFHYVCFAAFVSFPVIAAQLEFAAHVIPIGVSFLCGVLAVGLTLEAFPPSGRPKWLNLAAAILLCTVAAGAYQSAILNYAVILIPVVAYRTFLLDDHRYGDAVRIYLAGFGVLLLATVLYAVIAWAFMKAADVEPNSVYISDAYMAGDSGLFQVLLARMYEFPRGMYRVLYGWWFNFGIAKYVFALAVSFCAACILLRGAGSWPRFLATGVILAVIILAPGALILVSGKEMPLRTFVAAPAALTMIFLLAHTVSKSGLVRNTITALVVLFVVQCMYIQSTQQAQAWVTQRHDVALAGALNRDILGIVDVREGTDIKVDFYGIREAHNVYPRVPTAWIGESFVEWTRNHPVRLVLFMNLMGFYWYEIATDPDRERLRSNYASMSIWPRPGSIRVVDDVVLVKLGECEPTEDIWDQC
jgi:hypothetical protein